MFVCRAACRRVDADVRPAALCLRRCQLRYVPMPDQRTRFRLANAICTLAFGLVVSAAENPALDEGYAVARFDVPSTAVGKDVPTSVLLPPGFDRDSAPPLVVWLHGGGGDREQLPEYRPWLNELTRQDTIPPLVFVSFTTSAFSGFLGPWEDFIADELPHAMAERYGTRTDREAVAVAGISMGGYGALKSAFRRSDRFVAVAAMEPSVEPKFTR
ncbi:MAG: hypothetical protein F4Y01_10480, partial [Gammaproteobacteria bacterium]|nr:hypothetical protein [Gammaproteobacteria bacterium]